MRLKIASIFFFPDNGWIRVNFVPWYRREDSSIPNYCVIAWLFITYYTKSYFTPRSRHLRHTRETRSYKTVYIYIYIIFSKSLSKRLLTQRSNRFEYIHIYIHLVPTNSSNSTTTSYIYPYNFIRPLYFVEYHVSLQKSGSSAME